MWPAIDSLLSRVFRFARKRSPVSFRRETSPENRASAGLIVIVGIILDEADRRLLTGLGSRNQWNVSFADTLEEAQSLSQDLRAAAILYDRDAAGEDWGTALERFASSPHRPCVLLVSRVADDYLWNEVVRRGGYDLLSKPLREQDVSRAIKLAWLYWNSAARPAVLQA